MNWGWTMKKPDMTLQDLDALFETARTFDPEPSDAFLAHLEDQAVAALAPRPDPRRSSGFRWSDLRSLLGGWSGIGGLAVVAAAGVWFGVSPPELLIDPVTAFDTAWNYDTQGLGAGFGFGATDWVMSEDG